MNTIPENNQSNIAPLLRSESFCSSIYKQLEDIKDYMRGHLKTKQAEYIFPKIAQVMKDMKELQCHLQAVGIEPPDATGTQPISNDV